MFRMFDLNFKEMTFPKDKLGLGVRSLDLLISSIGQETYYKTLPGLPGNIDGGRRSSNRDVSIRVYLLSKDRKDYELKLDELYSYFRKLDVFYVASELTPNKLLKVRLSSQFLLSRDNQVLGQGDIPLDIVGSPYKVSRMKSMDIHRNGINLNNHNWDVGMGLLLEDDSHIYDFQNQTVINMYNAGDVALNTIQEYQDCIITIEALNNMLGFTINDAAGNRFIYNPHKESHLSLSSGDKVVINGPHVTLNGTNCLNATNVEWLEIVEAWNRITCSRGLKITFDYRFKYD